MRLVTLELSCLLGTGTVSKSGSVCVRTCVDSEGFWPAQFCVQFRADCPLHVAASLPVTSASCRYCSAVVQILTHGIMTVLLYCITRPDGKTVFMETATGTVEGTRLPRRLLLKHGAIINAEDNWRRNSVATGVGAWTSRHCDMLERVCYTAIFNLT